MRPSAELLPDQGRELLGFILTLSLTGKAQSRRIELERNPQAAKTENVKIVHLGNQEVLRIASSVDTIRIVANEEVWSQIETLLQAPVGRSITLKDIDGADVHVMRISKNTRPGLYFRNKINKSISIFDKELKEAKQK